MDAEENSGPAPLPVASAAPDYYLTGLAVLRDHGEGAVSIAAAIMQHALSELLAVAPERRILAKETTRSPHKLAIEACAAFETAGGLYHVVLHKLPPDVRASFEARLKERAASFLSGTATKPT